VHLPPGALDYRAPNSIDNHQQNITQEIRLQSNDADSKLFWTTGVFFSEDRQTYLEQIHDPLLNELSMAATGLPYTDWFVDPNGNPVLYNPAFPNDSYFLQTRAVDKQYALFAEGTYSFTDQYKLTLGARYSWTKFTNDSYTGGPQLFLPPQSVDVGQKDNSFTPKVSFSYQYDPRNLYYATYAKGFRPGGANNPVPQAACAQDFANFGITQSPPTFNSDTVNSFEVGAKNNIDNRVKIASSIYYIRWNNIQQTVVPPICQISFIDNLGTAVAKGGDIQADIAITDNFTAEIATGYTSARYTKDSTFPASAQPIAASGDAIVGNSGEPPGQPGAPFTATIGLEYKFMLFNRQSFIRVDDEYESRNTWYSPSQDPTTLQYDAADYTLPATNIASARAGMNFGNWQAAAFVDNLADSHTVTAYNWTINPGDGSSRLQRDYTFRPRTIGLTITYRH
jgi:outer membrane receptor protein involved in Fe transport